jgi:hypothetical protein
MRRIVVLFFLIIGSVPPLAIADDSAAQSDKANETSDKPTTVSDSKVDTKETEKEKDKPNGNGSFSTAVPQFTLKDSSGTEHSPDSLYKDTGMLLMITVPNLTQYERQKKWEKWIKKEAWPEQNAPRCVVVEDMSQQESYKDRARKLIADKGREDTHTLFLIDETGDTRRDFGVAQNETVILLVDSSGTVIHNESDDVEPERESAHRIAQQVKRLAGQCKTAPTETHVVTVTEVKSQVASTETAQR